MSRSTLPSITPSTSPEPPGGARPRRRGRRLLVTLVAVVAVLVGVFYLGGGWYFSGLIDSGGLATTPWDGTPTYDQTVVALADGTVTLEPVGDPSTAFAQASSYLLLWPGGSGHVGVPTVTGPTVTRPLADVTGTPLTVGTSATLERDWYQGTPQEALGLAYQDVTVTGGNGPMPAWYVPAAKATTTTAVLVHGRGTLRREMLRALEIVHAAGLNALVISYLGDYGVADYPDGRSGFGATEWPDLQAAVQWSLDHGTTKVVLWGNSMGGAVSAAFLRDSALASSVTAVVFDAAMLDFGAAVDYGASKKNLPVMGAPPQSLTAVAEWMSSLRFGVDYTALNYAADTSWVRVPTLAIQGTADPTVPVGIGRTFAANNPDHVQYEEFDGAAHLESWNTDRTRYTSVVTAFLATHAPA